MKTLILFACLTVCGVTAEVQLKLAPNVVTVTNEFKERETLIIWTNLPARYSGSLGENMIFRSVVLKRVTFMEKETRTLKAFDVTDLHPDVCDYHRIDVNTQVRKAQDAQQPTSVHKKPDWRRGISAKLNASAGSRKKLPSAPRMRGLQPSKRRSSSKGTWNCERLKRRNAKPTPKCRKL